MLPRPRDVEQCLQVAADTHRAEIVRLSAERAAGDDWGAAELTRLIAQAARRAEELDGEVFRTVLAADPATGEQEAFALVGHGGGRCVAAGGMSVSLVSLDSPAGRALRCCRPGDLLPLGRVLAADDSLTARAEARRQSEAEAAEQAARCRDRKAAEKQHEAAAREAAALREQEAFERRAAAHFQRPQASADGHAPPGGKQLQWPF